MNAKNFDFNTILNHLKILAINPFFSIPLFGIILVNIWNIDIEGGEFPLIDVFEGMFIEFCLKISLALTTILYLVAVVFKKIYNGLNLWVPIAPLAIMLYGMSDNQISYVIGFIFVFLLCSVGIFYGSRYLGNKFENYFIDPNF